MFLRILNLCTNLGKNFTNFSFYLRQKFSTEIKMDKKNTDISVYSNLLRKTFVKKKRRFKIRESCDEFVITQFKSYLRPPTYLNQHLRSETLCLLNVCAHCQVRDHPYITSAKDWVGGSQFQKITSFADVQYCIK